MAVLPLGFVFPSNLAFSQEPTASAQSSDVQDTELGNPVRPQGSTSISSAQPSGFRKKIMIGMQNRFKEQIESDLNRLTEGTSFLVQIQLELKERLQVKQIPYIPGLFIPEQKKSVSPSDLIQYLEKVKVKVIAPDKVIRGNHALLEEVVKDSLIGVDPSLLEVQFEGSSLEVQDENEAQQVALLHAKKAEKDLQSQLDNANQELLKMKQESLAEKQQRENELAELNRYRVETEKLVTQRQLYFLGAGFLALLLIVLFIPLLIGALGIRKLAASIALVGQKSATAIDDFGATIHRTFAKPKRSLKSGAKKKIIQHIPTDPGTTAQLKRLCDELRLQINEGNYGQVISFISSMQGDKHQLPEMVLALEMFGPEHANRLFHQLPASQRLEIMDFIKSGEYPRPKWQIMLDVGERLRGVFLASVLEIDTKKKADNSFAEKLEGFAGKVIATGLTRLPKDELEYMIHNLKSHKLGEVLEEIHVLSEEKLAEVAGVLPTLSGATKGKRLSTTQESRIEAMLTEIQNDGDKMLAFKIRSILSKASNKTSKKVMEVIKDHDQLFGHLRDFYVSAETLLELAAFQIKDVCSSLKLPDLAIFLISLNDLQRQKVLQCLDSLLRKNLEEELRMARNIQESNPEVFAKLKVESAEEIIENLTELRNGEGLIFDQPEQDMESPESDDSDDFNDVA